MTQQVPERALLAAVVGKAPGERVKGEHSLEELSRLAESAGAVVVGRILQLLDKPSPESYLGKGKLQEVIALKEENGYDIIILDDELTPNQQRNLEEVLKVKVIDRVALILDIFARRAHTREGRLQVELAQHQYLLPRLSGQWLHLERLGGGIGTRGPGESQLETDRRLIRARIQKLKKQTEDIRKHRALYRRRRRNSGIPVVALVGYTNAGKSTLINAMCQADIYADDRLFATLDPTTRRLTLNDGRTPILLTDTVGFIRKLPPAIIDAFRATLEELTEATLLVHVIDISSEDADEQCQTVEEILGTLDLTDKPRLTVINKIDRYLEMTGEMPVDRGAWDEEQVTGYFASRNMVPGEDTVHISASRKWGLTELLRKIQDIVGSNQDIQ